jgi:hypothetical protein
VTHPSADRDLPCYRVPFAFWADIEAPEVAHIPGAAREAGCRTKRSRAPRAKRQRWLGKRSAKTASLQAIRPLDPGPRYLAVIAGQGPAPIRTNEQPAEPPIHPKSQNKESRENSLLGVTQFRYARGRASLRFDIRP